MRYRAVLIATLVIAACNPSRDTPGEAPAVSPALEPVVEFLLTSAATDFHTHRRPDPVRFSDVRLGHVTIDGEKQYLLCGQFLPAERGADAEWTPFATIKTSGYEQWIGGQGAGYCEQSPVVWDEVGDLSVSLQSRLDSLRSGTGGPSRGVEH